MLNNKWTEHQLEDVEACPNEQTKILYKNMKIKEIGQVVTPTQVSLLTLHAFLKFAVGSPSGTSLQCVLLKYRICTTHV